MKKKDPQLRFWTGGQSGIHGRGLFAARDIPRTTRVIDYVGHRITKAEGWKRAIAWEKKTAGTGKGTVYVFELNARHDIDGNVPWNPARLINHSCRPNCEPRVIRGRIWYIALRRIRAGEELTIDYGYDMSRWERHPCRCGARGCPGFIVSQDHRARLRQLLANRAKLRNPESKLQ